MPAKTYTSPSQFSDVAAVLDAALAAGGGLYKLPTSGKAIRWRQRAYMLRSLLLKIDERMKQGTVPASTPYDNLVLRIRDDDPLTVRIEIEQPEGILTTLNSTPLELKEKLKLIDDPFLDELEDLVARKGL